MPIISLDWKLPENLIFILRLISGSVWFFTALRRLLSPNFDNFEGRIQAMSEGTTFFPDWFMAFAVENWFFFFLIVVTIEILCSISLLSGTFSRAGALLATFIGFAIGMAGIGLGIIDLLIPWSVAIITLFLLLFTHPGRYKGIDQILVEKDLPNILLMWT